MSTEKSTNILLKPPIESATMKSAGWSLKRTSNDDYRVNATYWWQPTGRSSTQHCTKARESASSLEIVKYHRFTETYMLDVGEWDETTRLTYMIDDHQWLWTMPAAEAPIDAKWWAEALPPWWLWPRTTPRYEPRVLYWMARWMPAEFGSGDKEELRSETRERRKWVYRVSGLRNGRKVINWAFLSFVSLFSSLLHTLLLDWISARYKWRWHGFLPPLESVKWRWIFPVRRIRRKVALSGTNR